MTTQEKQFADGLAARLDSRATDINCAHAYSDEERAVRRAMRLIYTELAEMIREEVRAQARDTTSATQTSNSPTATKGH